MLVSLHPYRFCDISRKHKFTSNSLLHWVLQSFCPLFCNDLKDSELSLMRRRWSFAITSNTIYGKRNDRIQSGARLTSNTLSLLHTVSVAYIFIIYSSIILSFIFLSPWVGFHYLINNFISSIHPPCTVLRVKSRSLHGSNLCK